MSNHVLRLTGAVILVSSFLFALLLPGVPAQAQAGGWTRPELVFQDSGLVDHVALVSDPYGQVNGFWLFTEQSLGTTGAVLVYYTRLDDPNWQPIDILVARNQGVGLAGATSANGLSLLINGSDYAWSGASPQRTAKDWAGPLALQQAYPKDRKSVV